MASKTPSSGTAAAHDELGEAPFRGGLSRREVDEIRQSWRTHITARGGFGFDGLDGFLTALSLLNRVAPERWLPLVLGDEFLNLDAEPRDRILSELQRMQTHVARRVSLDPDAHRDEVLPEFDFLPASEEESEEAAEKRTAQAWSAGTAAALALDPDRVTDMAGDERRRGWLAPFILLSREHLDDGKAIGPRDRRRLMVAAAKGAHQLWRHYVRPRMH